jgi:hypothetical protein
MRTGTGLCPSCLEVVLWTRTEPGSTTPGGKALPVERTPDSAGNTAVRVDGSGRHVSRQVTAAHPLMGYERLHMPHWAKCRSRTAQQTQLPVQLPAEQLPANVLPFAPRRARRPRS